MAALQGYLSGHEATLDELPPWKRELILRKRASARIHGGIGMPQPETLMAARPGRSSMSGRPPLSSPPGPPAGTLSSPPGPSAVAGSSLSGPGVRSLSGPAPSGPSPPPPTGFGNNRNWAASSRLVGASVSPRDGGEGRGYDASLPIASDINTSPNMHHKGLCEEGSRVTSPTSSTFSDSYNNHTDEQDPEEELSYGPGIVSKLKNRYMSIAMRERGRPALRRCSSLEDILDDDPVKIREHKEREAAPTSAAQFRLDRMKRARSVDSLSTRHRPEEGPYRGPSGRRPMPKSRSATSNLESSLRALGNDDVIIIETSKGVPAGPQQQQQQGQRKPFKDSRSSVNGGSPRYTDDVPPPLQRKLSSSSLAEEEELPPPDTVRSVRQVFEGGTSHVNVSSKPLRGTAARVAQHKTYKPNGIQSTGTKPALAIKPAVVPSHRKATPPLTPVSPPVTSNMPFSIEDAKKRLKHVAAVSRPSPRSTMGVKPTPDFNGEIKVQEPKALSPRPGLTPIIKSHTAPVAATITNGNQSPSPPIGRAHPAHDTDSEDDDDDDEDDEGFRKVSNTAISNIRKDAGLSQEFNFAKTSSSPVVGKVKPSSPVPAALPSSPIASHKVTSPTLSENQRVEQENRKNVEKSRSKAEPVKVNLSKVESVGVFGSSKVNSSGSGSPSVVLGNSPPVSGSPGSPDTEELVEAVNKKPLKTSPPQKAWHQQQSNTQTFNFTAKKAPVPEHLENDGMDMSIRRPKVRQLSSDSGYVIMPGFFEGRQDSSTDGDDPEDPGVDYLDSRPGVPPAPCGINFQGEAVIINGRSNLQRQPRNKRLNISFNDSMTATFEYPSESSFLEEDSEGGPVSPSSGDLPGTGVGPPHGPVASGTCSVTIRVGSQRPPHSALTKSSYYTPNSFSNQNTLHNPPQSSSGCATAPLNAFSYSSASRLSGRNGEKYNTEIENSGNLNVGKGPRDKYSKHGSIKFGKKDKKSKGLQGNFNFSQNMNEKPCEVKTSAQVANTSLIDNQTGKPYTKEGEMPDVFTRLTSDDYSKFIQYRAARRAALSSRNNSMQSNKQNNPSPTHNEVSSNKKIMQGNKVAPKPKPRTTIATKYNNSAQDGKKEMNYIKSPLSRAELKLDLKPVYEVNPMFEGSNLTKYHTEVTSARDKSLSPEPPHPKKYHTEVTSARDKSLSPEPPHPKNAFFRFNGAPVPFSKDRSNITKVNFERKLASPTSNLPINEAFNLNVTDVYSYNFHRNSDSKHDFKREGDRRRSAISSSLISHDVPTDNENFETNFYIKTDDATKFPHGGDSHCGSNSSSFPHGHPVLNELIIKFGSRDLCEKNCVERLRKVHTKEPKTIKELFPNYKYIQKNISKVPPLSSLKSPTITEQRQYLNESRVNTRNSVSHNIKNIPMVHSQPPTLHQILGKQKFQKVPEEYQNENTRSKEDGQQKHLVREAPKLKQTFSSRDHIQNSVFKEENVSKHQVDRDEAKASQTSSPSHSSSSSQYRRKKRMAPPSPGLSTASSLRSSPFPPIPHTANVIDKKCDNRDESPSPQGSKPVPPTRRSSGRSKAINIINSKEDIANEEWTTAEFKDENISISKDENISISEDYCSADNAVYNLQEDNESFNIRITEADGVRDNNSQISSISVQSSEMFVTNRCPSIKLSTSIIADESEARNNNLLTSPGRASPDEMACLLDSTVAEEELMQLGALSSVQKIQEDHIRRNDPTRTTVSKIVCFVSL